MDYLKDAFQKVKQDMDALWEEINSIKQFLFENQENFSFFEQKIQNLSNKIAEISQKEQLVIPTHHSQNTTITTNIPTHNYPLKPLKPQNLAFSTGNEGVPTNKPTNKPTNQQMKNPPFDAAVDALASLDNIKKEIRIKFKKMTEQEFLVFSTIYQMEEEGEVDYRSLSSKLNLTEASIRDYVGKLIKKGIPVEKTKINNKLIQLSISENLRKIAPLPVLLQLREI
jgi:hypothetical protein